MVIEVHRWTWAAPMAGHAYRRILRDELEQWLHSDVALAVAESALADPEVDHV